MPWPVLPINDLDRHVVDKGFAQAGEGKRDRHRAGARHAAIELKFLPAGRLHDPFGQRLAGEGVEHQQAIDAAGDPLGNVRPEADRHHAAGFDRHRRGGQPHRRGFDLCRWLGRILGRHGQPQRRLPPCGASAAKVMDVARPGWGCCKSFGCGCWKRASRYRPSPPIGLRNRRPAADSGRGGRPPPRR